MSSAFGYGVDLINQPQGGGGSVVVPGLVRLAQTILGSDAANVTFSSIPATYTNLLLLMTARSAAAVAEDLIFIQFNGDTGANYDYQLFEAFGTNVSSGTGSGTGQTSIRCGNVAGASNTRAAQPGSMAMWIYNYTSTTWEKTTTSENCEFAAGAGFNTPAVTLNSGNWRSTAAITSLLVFLNSAGNFKANSTFTLYGLT